MMFDTLTVIDIIIIAVVLWSGGCIKGYSGFGASMVWGAGLSLVFPPLEVVPLIMIFEIGSGLFLARSLRGAIHWPSLRLLWAGMILATPVGIYLLANLESDWLRIIMAVIVIAAALLIGKGFRWPTMPGARTILSLGGISGALNGSVGFAGPPIILFYLSANLGMKISRASMVIYFTGTDAFALIILAISGLIDQQDLARAAISAPFVLAGILTGRHFFRRTDQKWFEKISLFLLVTLAILLVGRVVII